jgi:tungstate transport system ATP-binding protein
VIREGRAILDVPELDIPQGDFLSVVGPNGAGKSTLLRLLAFLIRPDQGRLTFRGTDCGGPAWPVDLRRDVTLVMQRPYLFSGSVLSNAQYGLRVRGIRGEEARDLAENALDLVGLLPLRDRKAWTLSGGEGKRLAVARALAVQPQVLLLDEPTADVDQDNRTRIENLITDLHLNKNTTILLSTHDPSQANRLATNALSLTDGKIVPEIPS